MSAEDAVFGELEAREAQNEILAGAFLLDVREDDEWEAGHAPQAVHIALGELGARYEELPRDRTIVCVCRGGGRSARAAEALAGVGFTTINLVGGMRAWASEGLQVRNLSGEPGEVI
jgi:rhodanese-related sulfurtransferase